MILTVYSEITGNCLSFTVTIFLEYRLTYSEVCIINDSNYWDMRFKKGIDIQGGQFVTRGIVNEIRVVKSLETMYQPLSAIKRTPIATNAESFECLIRLTLEAIIRIKRLPADGSYD